MSPLLIGISAAVSLLFLASLVLAMMRQVRSAHDDVQGPMRDGKRVLATITDIQIGQDWKEGERWERSLWDGRLVRQKTWQMYYDVTAGWMHAQTKQSYTFREPGLVRRRGKATHNGTDGGLHRRPSSSSALCCGRSFHLLSEAYASRHGHDSCDLTE